MELKPKEPKTLDINKPSFMANGKEYFITSNLSITRFCEFQILEKEVGFSMNFDKVFQEINENSTVFDALKLASSYYTYVYYCIQDNIKEITEEEIEQLIKELREFVNWPDYTILDNITLLNEKDVMVIIKDRYQLLKINITKDLFN